MNTSKLSLSDDGTTLFFGLHRKKLPLDTLHGIQATVFNNGNDKAIAGKRQCF
jgi:hypothetical protein